MTLPLLGAGVENMFFRCPLGGPCLIAHAPLLKQEGGFPAFSGINVGKVDVL